MLKNDDEKWSRIFYSTSPFRVAAAQLKKICPERLNWPGRLAGISERAHGISKYFFLDHFSPSFLSQKLLFQELSSSRSRWCDVKENANIRNGVSKTRKKRPTYFMDGPLLNWPDERDEI